MKERSLSVIKTKKQYFMTLPVEWIRRRGIKAKDLLMVFSSDYYSSPLVICAQKNYMTNPELKKQVDKLIKILEKTEGVI